MSSCSGGGCSGGGSVSTPSFSVGSRPSSKNSQYSTESSEVVENFSMSGGDRSVSNITSPSFKTNSQYTPPPLEYFEGFFRIFLYGFIVIPSCLVLVLWLYMTVTGGFSSYSPGAEQAAPPANQAVHNQSLEKGDR